MPIGFYVLVEFDGTQKQTQNKPERVSDSVTEWDDVIVLYGHCIFYFTLCLLMLSVSRPSQTSNKIQLSLCASFELSPMVGKGEILHTLESSVEELERDDPCKCYVSGAG